MGDEELPVSKVGRNVAIAVGAVLGVGVLATAGWFGWKTFGPPPKRPPPLTHRAKAETCEASRGRKQRDPSLKGCVSDDECKEGKNGRCEKYYVGHARAENICRYDECFTDQDCRANHTSAGPYMMLFGNASKGPCMCGYEGSPNVCDNGDCSVDADCKGGLFCSRSRDFKCGSEGQNAGWFCHTAEDECRDDNDCADAGRKAECRFNGETKKWQCATGQCRVY
jgi:hypothetical protein